METFIGSEVRIKQYRVPLRGQFPDQLSVMVTVEARSCPEYHSPSDHGSDDQASIVLDRSCEWLLRIDQLLGLGLIHGIVLLEKELGQAAADHTVITIIDQRTKDPLALGPAASLALG